MSEERYLEICRMSMPEYRSLSAKEQWEFMAYPMSDEVRGRIMRELWDRQAPHPNADEGERK